MAIAVKDVTASAQKFVNRAQAAGGDYKTGVSTAGTKWQQSTAVSADSWAQGVNQAVADGRFVAGVNSTSAAKYQDRASNVGSQRYTQGVAGAQQNWANKTKPFLDVIAGITLPPRSPKGSPNNYNRVQIIGDALRKKRLGQ